MLHQPVQEITKILSMPRGSRLVYHVGFLTVDRFNEDNKNRAQHDEVADIAWNLHEAGKVALIQRRLGDRLYEYIAVRR